MRWKFALLCSDLLVFCFYPAIRHSSVSWFKLWAALTEMVLWSELGQVWSMNFVACVSMPVHFRLPHVSFSFYFHFMWVCNAVFILRFHMQTFFFFFFGPLNWHDATFAMSYSLNSSGSTNPGWAANEAARQPGDFQSSGDHWTTQTQIPSSDRTAYSFTTVLAGKSPWCRRRRHHQLTPPLQRHRYCYFITQLLGEAITRVVHFEIEDVRSV